MTICYYCHQEGHVVYDCPDVKPCNVCNKKGHSSYKCRDAPKMSPKVSPKIEPEEPNYFAYLDEPDEPNYFAYMDVPQVPEYLEETNYFAYMDVPETTFPHEDPRNYVKARNKNGYGLIWWREMEGA